jgi:two-component system, NarL family, response regulator NreC
LGPAKRVIKILIADSNMLFRGGLRTLLSTENEFRVMDEASDAPETIATMREIRPDVLIMDLALIEVHGQQAAVSLRQSHPSTAMLFLTREDEPEHLQMAITAGARAYMLKTSNPDQLIAAVRDVANSSDDSNPVGLSRVLPDLRALAASNQVIKRTPVLTAREQEVMKLLAEGRTVREVASELSLSVKTVEAHKLNLMRKLDIHNRAHLIEYAIHTGVIAAAVTR